ncbi:MAG: expansin EXLX1 family cellulose-binding protein, partial [Actinomycetota bacterium]
IEWRVVEAAVSGPIAFRFKEGSSQYWTAVQVRNHRHPVATLEYQLADGSWRAVARKPYNYFVEEAGMGPGPYTFRVTDVRGNVVVETGVDLAVAGVVSGAGQFP